MAKDHHLLEIARDYFQFVTNFLEVINVSATHIYHSALELSPLSSVVRRFYHSRRPDPLPRVVIGAQDSWDPGTVHIDPGEMGGLISTWSPCGRFVATLSHMVVEIRDALSLSTLSIFQLTEACSGYDCNALAYSPDGRSLACFFSTALVIWDIQTGGEIRRIGHDPIGGELAWSSDGTMIGTASFCGPMSHFLVHVYEVTSGTVRFSGRIGSRIRGPLWAHDKSFRLMTADPIQSTVKIHQLGSALITVEQFPLHTTPKFFSHAIFSHETYRVFLYGEAEFRVLDVRNLVVLLQETGYAHHASFSSDGNVLAASCGGQLLIWVYSSGRYTRWREFQHNPTWLQFSPASPSILDHTGALLHVLHLYYSPATLTIESSTTTRRRPLDAYSPQGVYIATTQRGESTIRITNLRSQNPSPSQFIDTGLGISGIVLTGNVLLVEGSTTGTFDPLLGSNRVAAWLLTEEGAVDGILDERRADRSDSVWDAPLGGRTLQRPEFLVQGKIAAIRRRGSTHFYCTKTGEIVKSDESPGSLWYSFSDPDLYYHSPSFRECREPPECDWPVLRTTLGGWWVQDLEGQHRLWLPPRWRSVEPYDMDWLGQVTTLRVKNSTGHLVVKF